MANEMALFKAAGLSLANIGQYKEALSRVAASAPVVGGMPILRLDKEGVWRFGQQLTDVQEGSLWAANPLSFMKGYTAWQENVNKPRGSQLKNILEKDNLVRESDLPDLAPAKWTESVEVCFKCLNGEDEGTEVKYMSNAKGGVERWYELVAQLSHQFDVDPTRLVAVCSLEHDGYFSNNANYGARHPKTKQPGWIVKPIFRVVEWRAFNGTTNSALEQDDEEEGGNGQVGSHGGSSADAAANAYTGNPAPTGRRPAIQPEGNGASAPPQPTGRRPAVTTSAVTPGDEQPANQQPAADPVVRRRRRVAS